MKTIIIMGSTSDQEWAKKITNKLDEYKIEHVEHVASAHKQAREALDILEKYKNEPVIYVTIAGRSNALSGFVAGNSDKPVIACPPFKDKEDMMINIHSTLQMPSNVPVMTILDPDNCGLAVKRIIELSN
jgi:5-(carboxyamino)imidazole ribonucleotide mutase